MSTFAESGIPEQVIRTTMIALDALLTTNAVALYELTMACRDASHVLWGNTGDVLQAMGMVDYVRPDGTAQIHDATREIVRHVVVGEGSDLTLQGP